MILNLDFKSGKPIYLQVVDQVKTAAASGSLQPRESLPPIRSLAEQLRVNRNTVAKAYTELEKQGVIETVTGKGCFITENNSPFKKQVRQQLLTQAIDAAIVQAHHLQVPAADFLELLHRRLEFFERRITPPSRSL